MRRVPSLWLLFVAVVAAACGHKIGDSCSVSSDCSQDGTRVCDTQSPGGLCTIAGCDFGTCPDEAVCVRFFPAVQDARACASGADCAVDEVCTVAGAAGTSGGRCAPRSIEQRFCMLSCGDNGDCREGYECRNLDLMRSHGGEPVPDPATATGMPPEKPQTSFCASRRSCQVQTDCDVGETCDLKSRICLPG